MSSFSRPDDSRHMSRAVAMAGLEWKLGRFQTTPSKGCLVERQRKTFLPGGGHTVFGIFGSATA